MNLSPSSFLSFSSADFAGHGDPADHASHVCVLRCKHAHQHKHTRRRERTPVHMRSTTPTCMPLRSSAMSSTCAVQRLAPRHVRRAATSTSNTTSSPGKPSCRSQEPASPLVKANIVNTSMLLIDLVEADAPWAANKPMCRHHLT